MARQSQVPAIFAAIGSSSHGKAKKSGSVKFSCRAVADDEVLYGRPFQHEQGTRPAGH